MSQQPAEEWDDMSTAQKNEIASRLHAVIADAERAEYRARLARASRPSRRIVQISPLD